MRRSRLFFLLLEITTCHLPDVNWVVKVIKAPGLFPIPGFYLKGGHLPVIQRAILPI